MVELDKIIKKIDRLRPVSSISSKIIEITSNPDSSMSELVDIITYDQAITANLLRICNSTYFGLTREITSIRHAVTYLGISKIVSLVLMETTTDNFKNAQSGYDLNEGDLWRYSVTSALIAQDLAEQKQHTNIPLIFTSALLKDIGKVILHTYVKDSFEAIINMVKKNNLSFIEAEKEIIGIDHAELGARVAERWNLSPAMVKIIKNHHNPDRSSPDDITAAIVYLADSICMMMGIGIGSDGLAYRHYQEVMDLLHFTNVDVQKAIANSFERLKDVETLVSLAGGN